VEGTNTGHEDAEGMASVGVRLTAELGHGGCAKRPCPSWVMALPLPERRRAPMGGQRCIESSSSVELVCSQIAGKLRVRVEPPGRLVRVGRFQQVHFGFVRLKCPQNWHRHLRAEKVQKWLRLAHLERPVIL
jgi:hypothetical protein